MDLHKRIQELEKLNSTLLETIIAVRKSHEANIQAFGQLQMFPFVRLEAR